MRKKKQSNQFLDDMGKVASSAMKSLSSATKDAEKNLKGFFKSCAKKSDLVTREEFDVLRDMVVRIRRDYDEIVKNNALKSSKTKAANSSVKTKTTTTVKDKTAASKKATATKTATKKNKPTSKK